ncbi:MAG: putative DNA-binding transcriptional regulator YafY [Arenicella sp.]|jgi:predicted DNA-binding transcriptional regulator YafY
MPSSKLAFFRYMLIDKMIRNKQKPYPSIQEILDSCEDQFGVRSISTIEKDLAALRLEFDAPIKYSKREKGYFYTDPNFKLMSVNLNEEHLVALGFVETFLEEFKFMPIFNEFSDAVDKVLDGLELTKRFNKNYRAVNKFIQIDKSPYYKGKDTLSDLIKVISDQSIVQIEYKKFGSETSQTYTMHPYLLKEFKNLWYLTGYAEERKQVRTFGIDRIEGFTVQKRYDFVTAEDVKFNAENFFESCYGITALNEEPEEIILRFSPQQGNYIKAQPIHHSLSILEDNDYEFKVSLKLVNNYELRSWILGFGSSVRVLQPETLRVGILKQLKEAVESY